MASPLDLGLGMRIVGRSVENLLDGRDHRVDDQSKPLSKAETRKDTAQVVIGSGAAHFGRIVGSAVREVTNELGDFATDVFEMRDASRRAQDDADDAEPAGTTST